MDDKKLISKIGARIKEIRISRAVSQQDLAAKCNFEKSNMSRIEAGKVNFTIRTLYKISIALNVKLKDIIDIDE